MLSGPRRRMIRLGANLQLGLDRAVEDAVIKKVPCTKLCRAPLRYEHLGRYFIATLER